MEELYQNLSHFNLWGDIRASDNTACEVTELWLHHATGAVRAKDRSVPAAGLDAWLAATAAGAGADEKTLIARFVWVGISVAGEEDKQVSLSSSVQSVLLSRFGLKLANKYSRSCLTGVTALPPVSTAEADRCAYSFSYAPKLAAIWSHSRFRSPQAPQCVTECLVFAQEKQKKQLKAYLNASSWRVELARLAMFPAFLISILLGVEINDTQESIKNELRHVEKRTGYHGFSSRYEKPATEELGSLSAKTSGHATKLASTGRKSKTLEKLLDFMRDKADGECSARQQSEGGRLEPSDQTGYDLLMSHVTVLKDRLEFQVMDADYTSKRIQTQINALFNLIAQRDSEASLELTQWTAEIALYSYRDSSSMKTLAVVTMFFLPGSFVSALFSTPCFDWDRVDLTARDDIGVPSTPQFRLYWAITIPLTVVTFVLYFLWLWFQKKQQRERETRRAEESDRIIHAVPDAPEEQLRAKARMRRETILNNRASS